MVFETERLILRKLQASDNAFIHELMNDAGYLRFIGDRGIRTPADAQRYILEGPVASYQTHGFGLYAVQLKTDDTLIGICGLIKRDTLPDVDVGYAFLPAFRGQGYAREAASGSLNYGWHTLGLTRILAITSPDNVRSIRLLEKLGLTLQEEISYGDEPSLLFSVSPQSKLN